MEKVKKSFKKFKGFTLIELLIGVLIIGVLAGIAIPQYRLAVGKSKYATIKNVAKAIADAEERYYIANNKHYTNDFSALDVNKPNDASCSISSGQGAIKAVSCVIYVNKVAVRYYQYFLRDQPSAAYKGGARLCLVYSVNKNDIPNKICQNDTGEKEGSVSKNGYITYWY